MLWASKLLSCRSLFSYLYFFAFSVYYTLYSIPTGSLSIFLSVIYLYNAIKYTQENVLQLLVSYTFSTTSHYPTTTTTKITTTTTTAAAADAAATTTTTTTSCLRN
jgi:hypothetical protein